MRCAAKCSSNRKAGRVAVTLGLPRNEVLHCTPAGPGCEDALGYEALIDANVDEQLREILKWDAAATAPVPRHAQAGAAAHRNLAYYAGATRAPGPTGPAPPPPAVPRPRASTPRLAH